MTEIIKKCFNVSISWQVTPMLVQELLCLSLASCCLPSNCLQATAEGLQSCLSAVQSTLWPPAQAIPAEQAAARGWKSWQEKKEGMTGSNSDTEKAPYSSDWPASLPPHKGRYVTATGTARASQSEYLKCSLKIKCSRIGAVFHGKKASNTRSADHIHVLFPSLCGPQNSMGKPQHRAVRGPTRLLRKLQLKLLLRRFGSTACDSTGAGTATGALIGAWIHPSVFPPAKPEQECFLTSWGTNR